MLCDPTLRELTVSDATPPLRELVPSALAPSVKLTWPPGVPAPPALAITVAVNVTVCPKVLGFGESARLMVVALLFTFCDTAAAPEALEALKLVSPE